MKKKTINIILYFTILSLSFPFIPANANFELKKTTVESTALSQPDLTTSLTEKSEISPYEFPEPTVNMDDHDHLETINLESQRLYQEHLADLGLNYSLDSHSELEERDSIPLRTEVIIETTLDVRGFDCSTAADVPQVECEALVALYESTNGAAWTNNSNWLVDIYIENWWGITVLDGHVSLLYLDLNQLIGVIPSKLGDLSGLTTLSLRGNSLTGSLPPELGNLGNLTTLYLYDNQLTGSIPPELGQLSNLKRLHLYRNQLTGSIPPELGNLSNLSDLMIYDNQLTGSIPPELGNLSNLYRLSLSYNQLTGSIPSELGNLSNLDSLALFSNQLTGIIPTELFSLNNLTDLALGQNQFVGVISPDFDNLSNLHTLLLNNNQFTGSIPPELANLSILNLLDLSNNQLSGTILSELANLTYLSRIFLGGNQLTGNIPPEFGNLSNLMHLNLAGNQLTGSIPPELGNLTNLSQILLYDNQLSGPIPLSFTSFPHLSRFWFYDTDICEPSTPEFIAWKETVIEWYGTDIICEQPLVSGRVIDSNFHGIALVTVSAISGESTTTDEQGYYALSLPEGLHTISASKAGYIFYPNTLTVDLNADRPEQNFYGETAFCAIGSLRADSNICGSPLASPFLKLPIETTTPPNVFLQDTYDHDNGRADSWFDHDKPTYYNDIDKSITVFDGIKRVNWYKSINGLGCYDERCYEGHPAIDFSPHNNEKNIIAAADGTIIDVCHWDGSDCKLSSDLGKYVVISHRDNTYATLYAHLESIASGIDVEVPVNSGDFLGVMGNTGNSKNTHLHFQVFFNDNKDEILSSTEVVDPYGWVEDKDDPWSQPSVCLWEDYCPENVLIISDSQTLSIGDVSVEVPANSGYENQLLSLIPTTFSSIVSYFRSLGDSFRLLLRDLFNPSSTLINQSSFASSRSITPVLVQIDYSDINSHLDASQLSLYRYDSISGEWIEVATTLDEINSIASASVLPDGYFDLQAPLLCPNDLTEPYDDKPSLKTQISSDLTDLTLTRWFDIQDDVDWFSIHGFTGITYTINTLNLSDGVDTELSVYLPDGETLLAFDDNSGGGLASSISFVAPQDGIYYIKASKTASSAFGCDSSYDIHISPIHQAPISDAGLDQTVDGGTLVCLDGSGSSDPDGNTPLTYEWIQIDGAEVTLNDNFISNPTFTAPFYSQVLRFSLQVTDNLGLISAPDSVTISVKGNNEVYLPLILR